MALTFERPIAVWDGNRDAVRFIGRDQGRTVQCYISLQAMQHRFGVTSDQVVELLQVFRKNADVIQSAAQRKYLRGDASPVGLIVLTSSDI